MREWIVILEATCRTSQIDVEAVRLLVEAVAALQPGALHSADRYALQLRVSADSPTQALAIALHRWNDEVNRIGHDLAACTLARAEVLTPEEYEYEHDTQGQVPLTSIAPVVDKSIDEGEKLLRRALLDSLTGLPTREVFTHEVDRALFASERSGSRLAVLFVDLDLGSAPQTLGRAGADHVRQRLAARITATVRPTDMVARLGADQFGVVLGDTSPERAAPVADRLVDVLQGPVPVGEELVVAFASVGIAMNEHHDRAEALVRHASLAAWSSKHKGDDRVTWSPAPAEENQPDESSAPEAGTRLQQDNAAYLAMLTAITRVANHATSLQDAARVAIKQVCAHTGWPAGRLYQRDGDALLPTEVTWASSPQWYQRWADAADVRSSSCGRSVHGSLTTVAVAGPKPGAMVTLTVPVLVRSEVVAALEFLADHTVDGDDVLVEVLASVGIQLGRVVERDSPQLALHPWRTTSATDTSR